MVYWYVLKYINFRFNGVDKNKNSLEIEGNVWFVHAFQQYNTQKKKYNSKIAKNNYENIIPKTLWKIRRKNKHNPKTTEKF